MTISMVDLANGLMWFGGLYAVYGVIRLIYVIGKWQGVKEYEKYKEDQS